MNLRTGWLVGAALAVSIGVAFAQAEKSSTPLLRHDFAGDESGWTVIGQNAKASVTREAAHVKEGKGALQYNYNVAKGEFSALILPITDSKLAKMKSLRFWVKTDHDTSLACVLQEKEGGRYMAIFTLPKEKWQQVELAPSDFALTEGKDDPKDPNNRLDLDLVEGVAIGDFAQFIAQADANLANLFGVTMGPRALWLNVFTASEDAIPESFSAVNGDVRLDRFVRPQLSWIGVGGLTLSAVSGKPLEGKGIQATYRQEQGRLAGIVKPFARGRLTGTEKLAFTIASAKPTKIVVQVEENDGGKYNAIIDLPGGETAQSISLKFADFTPSDDSKDTNGKLDLDQVKQVIFIDFTGFITQTSQDNTLWIGGLRAMPAQ